MEFWSKGLGRRSLILELGKETVENDGAQLVLSGKVRAPVSWKYAMYLDAEDWNEFFELALKPPMARYLLCRERIGALIRLTQFLFRFLGRYAWALVRVRLRPEATDPAATQIGSVAINDASVSADPPEGT
jgi:hypothetical protein